jgi:hypothetical protein
LTLWELIGIGALGLGIAAIAVAKFAAGPRRSKSSPSRRGGFFSSIAFAAVMIAREPSLVVAGLTICLQMLRRGRIPITGSTWSPSRAAKFDLENWGFSDSLHCPPEDAPRRPKAISS